MALTDATLNVGGDAMAAIMPYLSLHSAAPNGSGSNETTAGRVAANWTSSTNGGDFATSGAKNFTGGASNGSVTHVGMWSASTGGTFRGSFAVTGDASFNSAGEYTLDSFAISGT